MRLRDDRPAASLRELDDSSDVIGQQAVARNEHAARRAFDRTSQRRGRVRRRPVGDAPRLPICTTVEGKVEPDAVVRCCQRFTQRDVHMHGSGGAAGRAKSRRNHARGERPPVAH